MINNYLSNFWFILLLLTIASYLVIFLDPMEAIAFSFGKNGEFYQLYLIIWRFWVLFLLPLAAISCIVAIIIWLKDKSGNSHRGLSALIITILSLGLLFLFVPKLLMLNSDIKSNTGIFSELFEKNTTVLSAEELANLNIIFKYGVGAKNELDTFKQAYTEDMVMDPSVTITLKLTDNELVGINKMISNLNLFNEKKANINENMSATPCSSYYLKAKIGSVWQELYWDDCHGKVSDRLQTLTNYITQIIQSKDEYKKLPIPKGGYL